MKEKKPEFGTIGPIWWHHHGTKMKLQKDKCTKNSVVIEGSAAEVKITRAPGSKGWFVDWRINHPFYAQVNGRTWMEDSELAIAFGLKDDIGQLSEWLIDRFGGSAAAQFKFIRYEDFLNIPCPGTGHDGDPNVSIKITEEIKEAIQGLIFKI